ncbi:MAG: hypothetical protein ACLFVG_04750 [Candidatus Aminicenantes bacterium]
MVAPLLEKPALFFPFDTMKNAKFLLLLIGLIGFSAISHFFLKDNFHSKVRFFNDYWDRSAYFDRGQWYTLKKIPYLDIFSEYPQIATYFFALPHVLLSAFCGSNYGRDPYYFIFSTFMMIFLWASILLLHHLRTRHKHFAFLMLLPASVYFSYNRYDIIPAFLSILSIKLLSKQRYNLSIIILALGVMTKWYLILILPIFLNFYYSRHKKINWKMIIVFCVTIILCVLPTLLTAGVEAFLSPYKMHIEREFNADSTFYLVKTFFQNRWQINIAAPVGYFIFFALQFSVIPLIFIKKINTLPKVVNWSALVLLVFLLFAKFYSPQWILWVLPFLILRIQKVKDIFWVVIFDLVTYAYFPIIFDSCKSLLSTMIIIKTAVLACLVVLLFKNLVIKAKHWKKAKEIL